MAPDDRRTLCVRESISKSENHRREMERIARKERKEDKKKKELEEIHFAKLN